MWDFKEENWDYFEKAGELGTCLSARAFTYLQDRMDAFILPVTCTLQIKGLHKCMKQSTSTVTRVEVLLIKNLSPCSNIT